MQKVKKWIEAGVSVPTAIREALEQNGLTISAFAEKYDLPRSPLNEAINGTRRATPEIHAALTKELGGDEEAWREVLKEAAAAAA